LNTGNDDEQRQRTDRSELAEGLASLREDAGLAPAEELRMQVPEVSVNLPIDDICNRIADLLKASDGRWGLFRRNGKIGYIDEKNQWREMTARRFRTWLPDVRGILPVHKYIKGEPDDNGRRKDIPFKGEFTLDQAATMLESDVLLRKLPEIEHIHRVKMPILREETEEIERTTYSAEEGKDVVVKKTRRKIELLPEGFDARSKTLTLAHGFDYAEDVPPDDALKWIMDRLKYFPFADSNFGSMQGSRSKAIIVSGMMTVYAARLFTGRSPMHALTANEPGSGKSVLARWMLQPVWGEPASAGWSHEDRKETRQSFDSVAQAGGEYIFFDNVPTLSKGQIKNSDLERWLTQGRWGCRVLGSKEWFDGPLYAATIATGNWMKFHDDIERRTLLVDMFAQERAADRERPTDQIDFDDDFFRDDENMRMTLACLWSLVKWWDENDRPGIWHEGKLQKPLASFESWSKTIPAIVATGGFGNALQRFTAPDVGNEEAGQLEKLKQAVMLEFCGDKDQVEIELREVVGVARRHGLFTERLWTVEGVLESEGDKGGFKYKEPDIGMVVESVEKRKQAECWMSPGMRSSFGKLFKNKIANGKLWRALNGEVWLVGSRDAELTNGTSKVVMRKQAPQA
jgi:hypothetical protein